MADIFRYILLLNDPSIIEYLLSQDEVFRCVSGIFEYDKSLRHRGQYRQFLFETSQLKEVIELSEEVRLASKFLFRLKYVRDIMLHPTIDDPGITAINSMITFTSGEICSKVMNDEKYMKELFEVINPNIFYHLTKEEKKKFNFSLTSHLPSVKGRERKRANSILPNSFFGVLFLKELINLSKFMSYDRRYARSTMHFFLLLSSISSVFYCVCVSCFLFLVLVSVVR
jgi:hypothetical protein